MWARSVPVAPPMGQKWAEGVSGGPEVGWGHFWLAGSGPREPLVQPKYARGHLRWAGSGPGTLPDDLKWAGGTYSVLEVDRERLRWTRSGRAPSMGWKWAGDDSSGPEMGWGTSGGLEVGWGVLGRPELGWGRLWWVGSRPGVLPMG